MGIQGIISGLLFAGAVFYIGRKIYVKFFISKPQVGCEKCSIDETLGNSSKKNNEQKKSSPVKKNF